MQVTLYKGSPIVEKAKKKKLVVFDKDGCIQSNPKPLADPPESEISAGREIRRITSDYVAVASSAQTLELGIDSKTYQRSVEYGFKRPPPKIVLPDGTCTSKPENVRGWEYLLNFDAFIGFGSGIYVLKNGGYVHNHGYDAALGGPTWRPRVLESLYRLYPDGSFKRRLAPVDQEGLYENGEVDVAPLDYRVQFEHSDVAERDDLHLRLTAEQLRGSTPSLALVDESNLRKRRFTTYLVPKHGQKERGLERFGNELSFHSGVPMEEFEITIFGDSPTDLKSGLQAFQGAAHVTFILAAKSRLTQSLDENLLDFAGVPLMWTRRHPGLSPRYTKTATPGVYHYQAHRLMPPRKVILADHAPWSRGLECTESVLACLKHLGF